jgi:riboflavin biosynthesis pyrimidine reductase
MAMAATVHEAQQEEFLSTLRKGQEIALDALKTLVETIQFVTPPVPVIHVPTVHEVVAAGNQLAEQLLDNQRQFADEVITVLSPLLPGKAGKPAAKSGERKHAAKSGERKPAATDKAGKAAAA